MPIFCINSSNWSTGKAFLNVLFRFSKNFFVSHANQKGYLYICRNY